MCSKGLPVFQPEGLKVPTKGMWVFQPEDQRHVLRACLHSSGIITLDVILCQSSHVVELIFLYSLWGREKRHMVERENGKRKYWERWLELERPEKFFQHLMRADAESPQQNR